jgi:hypothetical protein
MNPTDSSLNQPDDRDDPRAVPSGGQDEEVSVGDLWDLSLIANKLRRDAISSLTLVVLLTSAAIFFGSVLISHWTFLIGSESLDATVGSMIVLLTYSIWILSRRAIGAYLNAHSAIDILTLYKSELARKKGDSATK